jgi:AcrR family transcriptional regulator
MSAPAITTLDVVVRWEPGTPERLQRAALELFAERGFEQTTATDIAQAVGVTERTFFRHFADKREVLFQGQQAFERAFLDGLESAPADARPVQLIAAALHSAALLFTDERRPYSRLRQTVIDANPALQERERHKLAGLATSLAAALRDRGVDELSAALAAESGTVVFGVAFTHWIREGETRPLDEFTAGALARLCVLYGDRPLGPDEHRAQPGTERTVRTGAGAARRR